MKRQQKESLPSNYTQLTLLDYKPGIEELRDMISELKDRNEKLRKSLYARNNYNEKEIQEVKIELEYIKSAICRPKG